MPTPTHLELGEIGLQDVLLLDPQPGVESIVFTTSDHTPPLAAALAAAFPRLKEAVTNVRIGLSESERFIRALQSALPRLGSMWGLDCHHITFVDFSVPAGTPVV
jgi:hypothetical protein